MPRLSRCSTAGVSSLVCNAGMPLYVHMACTCLQGSLQARFTCMQYNSPLLQTYQLKQPYASRYVSCCNRRGMSTTMLIPADLQEAYFLPKMDASTSRAGLEDPRASRAVFLGSPTGWEYGRRHAVCKAGVLHPDHM